MTTVAVFFGSRSWTDLARISAAMDDLLLAGDGSLVVITGANGIARNAPRSDPGAGPPDHSADALADWEARRRGFIPTRVWADWAAHDWEGASLIPCHHQPRSDSSGRDYCPTAGIRRNQEIIDRHLLPAMERGDHVTARGFRSKGNSPGTDDMLRRLKAADITGRLFHADPADTPPEARVVRTAPAPRFEPWPPPPWPQQAAS